MYPRIEVDKKEDNIKVGRASNQIIGIKTVTEIITKIIAIITIMKEINQ